MSYGEVKWGPFLLCRLSAVTAPHGPRSVADVQQPLAVQRLGSCAGALTSCLSLWSTRPTQLSLRQRRNSTDHLNAAAPTCITAILAFSYICNA